MKRMMRRLFALLMAVMMLCGSLPLSALAEIAPSDPIEEHSQGVQLMSVLGDEIEEPDTSELEQDTSADNSVADFFDQVTNKDELAVPNAAIWLINDGDIDYEYNEKPETVAVGKRLTFALYFDLEMDGEKNLQDTTLTLEAGAYGDSKTIMEDRHLVLTKVDQGYAGFYCTYDVGPKDQIVELSVNGYGGGDIEPIILTVADTPAYTVTKTLSFNGDSQAQAIVNETETKTETNERYTYDPAGENILTYEITVTNTGNTVLNLSLSTTELESGDGSEYESKTIQVEYSYDSDPEGSWNYEYTVQSTDKYLKDVTTILCEDIEDKELEIDTTVEDYPELTVEMTADKTEGANLNEEITYTITVTNSGNVPVSNITVTDTTETEEPTWPNKTIDSLDPGESEEFTTTHTITEEDILGDGVMRTVKAEGTAQNTGGGTTQVSDEAEVTVDTVEADQTLHVTKKTAEPTSGVEVGDVITYTITVTGSRNLTVNNITVTDELTGLKDENVGTLTPGASAEAITTKYTVTQADVDKGEIVNTATAEGYDVGGDRVPGEGKATVTTIAAASALTVTNSASKTSGAALGEEITYTITVTNSGNVTVSDITVSDPLTGLNQSVGTLAPGEDASVTTKHTITEADILAGSFVNIATASGTDPKGGDVTKSDDETVTPVAAAPALTVEKTADKTTGAALNDVINYTITVTNSGNVTVNNITVTDPLSGLNQSVGTLAPGASTEAITTTYTVTQADVDAGSFVNTATASGTGANGSSVSNKGEATVKTVEAAPVLTVEKKADKTEGVALGEEITYTITVKNDGNVTVSDITVTDPLTGLEKSVGPLAPGASAVAITTKYTVQEKDILAGKIENTATAKGTDPNSDEVTGSDNETVTTAAQAPALTVEKTASKTEGAALGEEITYTITVTNSGNVTVSDIAVTDEKTGLNETIESLAPGESKEYTTTHTITAEDIEAGSYVNTATATGTDPNGGKVNGSDDETVTPVAAVRTWTVEKRVEGTTGAEGKAVVGDELTYTVTVKNTGNVNLTGKTLTDEFKVDNVVNNEALTWTEGKPNEAFNLAPNETKTFKATYTVQATDNELSNTATVDGQTDTETTEVVGKDAWTVEKTMRGATGDGGAAKVGDELTYTVTVKNTGNTDLTGKTLTDEFSVDGVVKSDVLTWAEGSDPTQAFDLAQGATKTFTATYTVQATDNELSNTATVDGQASEAIETSVEDKDAWTVTKTVEGATGADGKAVVGNVLTYTVTVKNTGNTELSNLTLTDEFSVDGVVNNEALTWTEGNLAEMFDLKQGATKTFTATYTVQATDNELNNTAKTDDDHSSTISTKVEGKDAWTVEKTVSGASGESGAAKVDDELTYTVTVKNTGNTDLSSLELEDEFSVDEVAKNEALTWAEGSDPTQTFDLAQGETKTFTATYTVQATDKKLSNTATVGEEKTTIPTEVEDKPGLTVEKTANKTSGAALGEEITYTIKVTNSGNVTVSDITVTDPKTGLEESAGTLAPGASTSVTTKHTITEADILAGSFENTATAAGTDPNGDEVTGSDDETVTTVAQAPGLTVEKTADKTSGAALGEEISYTITVTNSGNVTVSDIAVTDEKTGLNETIASLAPGESKEYTTKHTITEADILAGSFENTATATGTNPKGGEVTGSDDETVTPVAAAPALTVVKTADKTSGAALGEEITYTIAVTNSGNVTVSDITVNDPKTGLEKSIETLAPGEDASVTTRHTITEADILTGSFVNTATVTGKDPNGGEVTGSDDETVTPAAQAPALTVEKTANKTEGAALGEEISYTITVTNSGNVTVNDITVTDPKTGFEESIETLAPGESASVTTTHKITEADILAGSFVNTATATGTDPKDGEVTGSDDETVTTVEQAPALTVEKTANKTSGAALNDVITYTITVTNSGNVTVSDITVNDPLTDLEQSVGTLAPNESTSVTTKHTISEADILAGSFVNTATATGSDPKDGEVTGSGNATVTTVEPAPALMVVKTADKTSGAALGEEISYTITVTNSGNVTVSDITVADPLTDLEQSAGTLAPGASTSVSTTHKITEDDILAGSFVNTATATGTDPKGGEVTGSDDETVTTVEQAPALTVEKTADKTSGAALNDVITYTITVTNSGNVTVSDITVTDPKTGLEESAGTLAPGENASVTTTHKITEADILAGSFVNTATAAGTDPNGKDVTGSDDETVTPVAAAPALRVVTSANKYDHEELGETITYMIRVTNSGNVTVRDITVTDPLTGLKQSVGTLAPCEDAEPITTTYIVTEGDIIDGKVENTATATGKASNGVEVTGSGPATVRTVDAAPALTVEKTADKTSGAELNDGITYTITVTNSGNETVNHITVTDPLTGLEKSAGTLAPGASAEAITTTYTVTEADIIAGKIENTATATGTDPKNGKVTDSGSATVTTVEQAPALTVVKTASKTEDAALGEEITYTIAVTNSGNVTVKDIAVSDPKTGLEESAGTLAPGESTSVTTTHTITEADILAGSFVNTATATGTDPDGEAVTGSDDETVTTVEPAPALTVEKTASKTSGAAPDDVISYTITVTNSGNVTVNEITVTDPLTGLNQSAGTLAPGASAEAITTTYTVQERDILAGKIENTATATGTDPNGEEVTGSDDETVTTVAQNPELTVVKTADKTGGAALGEEITYTITVTNSGNETVSEITVTDPLTGLAQSIGTLASGASAEAITTTYTVQEKDILAGKIENTATATGKDPKGGKVTDSDGETVTTVAQNPALTVEKTAGKTTGAELGEEISYTIKVTNSGNVTVSDVTVTDPKTGLEESVGTLAPGKDASVTTTHTITAEDIGAGRFVNTATAAGTDPKGKAVTGSDDETVTTVAAAPALTVEKAADKTTGAELGEEITYTITVTNSGNVTVKDITVTDEKTGLNEAIESLVPGADAVTFTTQHKISEADILAGSFVNTATAKGTGPNGGAVTGSDDETVTTVAAAPALTVEKTANKTTGAELGEEISYTIKVTNSGNVTVRGITVTDPKTGLNESIESLAPGADPVIYTTKHTISEADILVGSFVNTATAKGTDPNGGEVAGSDDETVTTVAAAPALTVEKTASKTTGAELGEEISYTITVTNSGNVTVRGITVNDPKTGLNEAIDSLAPKASKEYTTKHTISEADILAGRFVNTATATGSDPNGGEVSGSDGATVTTAEPNPALTVEKSATSKPANGTVYALGEEISYAIKVTNSGNVTVRDITVTDPKTGLKETIESLAPDESKEYTTKHTTAEVDILAGRFVNTATATGTDPKGGKISGSDDETVTTAAPAPAWTVEKTVSGATGADGKAVVGDVLTYTVTVENTGNTNLSNLNLTDEFIVDGAVKNDALTWTEGDPAEAFDLALGATKTFTATYTVQATDNSLSNTATVGDETATIPTPVEDKDAWTVTETVEGASGADGRAVVGDVLTYTVTVENIGNTNLSNLTLTDEFSVDGVVKNGALTWTEGSDPAQAIAATYAAKNGAPIRAGGGLRSGAGVRPGAGRDEGVHRDVHGAGDG